MEPLATVLLLHEASAGRHYDWMIEDPRTGGPGSPLWTARVDWPTEAWATHSPMTLQALPPHRREYLTYEGPISGGRGDVIRVDQGQATPLLWTDERILLEVLFERFQGRVELLSLPESRWQAVVTPASRG